MNYIASGILCVALLAVAAGAQPMDGDLIIGQFRDPTATSSTYGPGSILSINSANGAVYTIAASFTRTSSLTMGPNFISMATDNKNFMVASIPSASSPTVLGNSVWLHSVSTAGAIIRTLVEDWNPPNISTRNCCHSFDLDHDGTWILAGALSLWSFNEDTSTCKTLWSSWAPTGDHNAIVIDRAQTGGPYVLGKLNQGPNQLPKLMTADRSGLVTTITWGRGPSYVTGLEIDLLTGDYIASGFGYFGAEFGGFR